MRVNYLLQKILEVTEQQSQTLFIQWSVGQHGSNTNCGSKGHQRTRSKWRLTGKKFRPEFLVLCEYKNALKKRKKYCINVVDVI